MKLVLLGRDGVINEYVTQGVTSIEEWRPINGSLRALAKLSFAHYQNIVITNQPYISQGRLSPVTLNQIHEKMNKGVALEGGRIDAIYYCPHQEQDDCQCRIPKPGMIHELSKRLSVDFKNVPLIGDTLDDVQLAQLIGAHPILLRSVRGQDLLDRGSVPEEVEVHDNLASAVSAILNR